MCWAVMGFKARSSIFSLLSVDLENTSVQIISNKKPHSSMSLLIHRNQLRRSVINVLHLLTVLSFFTTSLSLPPPPYIPRRLATAPTATTTPKPAIPSSPPPTQVTDGGTTTSDDQSRALHRSLRRDFCERLRYHRQLARVSEFSFPLSLFPSFPSFPSYPSFRLRLLSRSSRKHVPAANKAIRARRRIFSYFQGVVL